MPIQKYLKININSKRIVLRPYKLTDFSSCKESHENRLKKCNDFDVPIRIGSVDTYCEFKKIVEKFRKDGNAKTHFIFGVFDKKNNEHLGQIDFFVINSELRWTNLGYHIHNQYWGKGYASEACTLALKAAFKLLNFHRVEAGIEPRNKPSISVAKKIGMIFEGKRDKFFPEDGGIDMVIYGANSIDYK